MEVSDTGKGIRKKDLRNVFRPHLLNNSQEDLMKIEHFRLEDVKEIWGILEKHFAIDLPKKKL